MSDQEKDKQKELLTEIMRADEKDGLYQQADQPELTAKSIAQKAFWQFPLEEKHPQIDEYVSKLEAEITALVEQGVLLQQHKDGGDFNDGFEAGMTYPKKGIPEAEALKREEAAIMATVNWLSDRENYPEAGETEAFIQDYLKTKKDGE